jgi:hypothetical protein
MGEAAVPQLRVSELYTKRQSRDEARLRAYNKILEQIHHRIRVMSKLPGNACYLMYTIPPFILGLPKIDMEDCVVYIIYQLRNEGFETRYSYPNLIYISWRHHEKNYILEQSPILQAMITTAEQAKIDAAKADKAGKQLQGLFGGPKVGRPPKASGEARGGAGASGPSPKKVSFGGAATMPAPSARQLGSAAAAGPSVGRNPTAADYTPPASFINTIEKPETKFSPEMRYF